jgi:hypothetical protein
MLFNRFDISEHEETFQNRKNEINKRFIHWFELSDSGNTKKLKRQITYLKLNKELIS